MKYSLDCARLSAIVYKNDSDAHSEINSLYEVSNFIFFDSKGTQALSFISNDKLFICFRGTEPTKFSDIAADLKAWQLQDSKYKTGKVHAGFKAALDAVWPVMLPYLEKHLADKEVVVTGHSLGAALATLCANRLSKDFKVSNISLYTFGSPRVGDKRWASNFTVPSYRFVNNNDIVTTVPGDVLFDHIGNLIYINYYGYIRDMTRWQRTKDKWRGFWNAIKRFEGVDFFNDHSMKFYLAKVENNIDILHSGR